MTTAELIGSSFNYGGLVLKNRIIFAPTTMGLGKKDYLERIKGLAMGGCAMIIIGDVPVSKSKMPISLFTRQGFTWYQTICQTAHAYDCKVCAQLHQNDTSFKSMFKYIPQLITGKVTQMDLRHLMNKETGNYISDLPSEKVKSITDSFGDAAVKALEAGFDLVQVHGDRMCGSFSSSLFNHRQDEYGGTAVNRARFEIEAVKSIRKKLPDAPIDYKLAVRQENPHYGNAGVLFEEIETFVPLLEEAGVTSFHVALANHGKLENTIPPRNHPYFSDEGCFLPFCEEIKKYTSLPVCGVGALSNPDFIAHEISQGHIDVAAMSRQLIADPEWVNKVLQGRADTIKHCTRCNKECLGGMYQHKGVHCIYEGAKL